MYIAVCAPIIPCHAIWSLWELKSKTFGHCLILVFMLYGDLFKLSNLILKRDNTIVVSKKTDYSILKNMLQKVVI